MFARLGRKLTETRCRPRAAQRGRVGDCRPANSESEIEGEEEGEKEREREKGREKKSHRGWMESMKSRKKVSRRTGGKGVGGGGGGEGERRTESARDVAPRAALPGCGREIKR